MNKNYWFACSDCSREFATDVARCPCGGLLEVAIDFSHISGVPKERVIDKNSPSGVWRYKALVHPSINDPAIVSRGEGNTFCYTHPGLSDFTGIKGILAKHEGENPTGSFKDRGMTVGVSEAKRQGVTGVACASTGNTSSSLASYAALAGISCKVFLPKGKVAAGKLGQTRSYGAEIVEVEGNFDDAMAYAEKHSRENGVYLLNSVNPWRIQGQKTIAFELAEQSGWRLPDWIVLPAGNLGNTTAFCKALLELEELGWIEKIPRIAAIQASGANPFYQSWKTGKETIIPQPKTIASAIQIGNPVSLRRALKYLRQVNGIVEQVGDGEILAAKRIVDSCGIGCEPASAASVAGARKLAAGRVIRPDEKVACILTGNLLKDIAVNQLAAPSVR